MLSEKPWNRDVLLLLVAGLLVSWCFGTLVGILLERLLPVEAFATKSFYRFVVNTLTLDVVTLLLLHQFLRLHGTTWGEFLGVNRSGITRSLLFAILVGTLALPVILALNGWVLMLITSMNKQLVTEEPAIKVLRSTVGLGKQIYFGFAAIVLAPMAEEALFRGVLYPSIKQMGHPRMAVWMTSILFGAIHMNLVVFLPLTLFGLVLVFIYEKTDRLIAPIVAHAFFNAVNFFFSIFEPELGRWIHRFWH